MTDTQRLLWRVCFSALAIGIVTVGGSTWLEAGQYEAPLVFTSSQALPPDLAHSPNYTVDERVGIEIFQ